MATPKREKTCGIIVIGDEVLRGQTLDTNSHFLCKKLFEIGVSVQRISVIRDRLDEIAAEVRQFSSQFDLVFTSGGVGPTHDDITMEGVARAFDDVVEPHSKLVDLCKRYFKVDTLTAAQLKMTTIPRSSQIHFGVNRVTGERSPFPVVNVKNVYVLPGVPALLERAFSLMQERFRNEHAQFHTRTLFIAIEELAIADALNEANERFKSDVAIGSYPNFQNSYYKVKVTMQSNDAESVKRTAEFLEAKIGREHMVAYDADPVKSAVERVYGLAQEATPLGRAVRDAVAIVEESLKQHRPEEICVGFNGGKDCSAVLHLYHAVLQKVQPQAKIKVLYIVNKQPFDETEAFIRKAAVRYDMEMVTMNGPIRKCLDDLRHLHPEVKAVVMGQRSTDPRSVDMRPLQMTDPDWPQFLRVSPILHWSYGHVWAFIRSLFLPYCSLYDRGYTSLGGQAETRPNPHLRTTDQLGNVVYRPAYLLDDEHLERDGRIESKI